MYDKENPKQLIATVNFFQWEPDVPFFERTIAVKKSVQSKGYGREIAIALNNFILSQYSPCIIAERCDRKQCHETLMIGGMKIFGANCDEFQGYWCANSELAQLSYAEASNSIGLSEMHEFHPKHWILRP